MNKLDFEKYYPDLSIILSDISDINSAKNIVQYFNFDIKKRDDLEKWKSYFTELRDQVDEILSYDDFPQKLVNNTSKELFEKLSKKLDGEINKINTKIPKERWNTGKTPEPITKSYPSLGDGGATQAITTTPIKKYNL